MTRPIFDFWKYYTSLDNTHDDFGILDKSGYEMGRDTSVLPASHNGVTSSAKENLPIG
jgi:hypothetical protein